MYVCALCVGITQQYIPIYTIVNIYSSHKFNVPGVMVLHDLSISTTVLYVQIYMYIQLLVDYS
jgi:hypothetical protein